MLILVEIFIVMPFFLHQALSTWSSSSSLRILLGGSYTVLFWFGFVLLGLLIPLAIEGFELFPVVWREQAVKYSRLWAGIGRRPGAGRGRGPALCDRVRRPGLALFAVVHALVHVAEEGIPMKVLRNVRRVAAWRSWD